MMSFTLWIEYVLSLYADDEQVHDSGKDPVREAEQRFGVNDMTENPDKYQMMVLGNTYHVFSFHVDSIKIHVV